jgi:CTP synthase
VLGLRKAHSTEFDRETPDPVIALITEWQDQSGSRQVRGADSEKGGTMRLGAQRCLLEPDTLARRCYGQSEIFERHRHRYEFNNTYLERFKAMGLVFSGRSEDGLVEVVELKDHPWFLATQFHPEFTSNPRKGHPLFSSFVSAARECQGLRLPRAVRA